MMDVKKFARDTENHAIDVEAMLVGAARLLATAGFHHDMHKYANADDYVEYLNAKAEGRIAKSEVYADHVSVSRHHLHKKTSSMEDATLIDVLVMLADWVSASGRRGTILDPTSTHLPDLDFEGLLRNTLRMFVTIKTDESVRDILEVDEDITITRGTKDLPKFLKAIAYDIDARCDVDSTHQRQVAGYCDLLNDNPS